MGLPERHNIKVTRRASRGAARARGERVLLGLGSGLLEIEPSRVPVRMGTVLILLKCVEGARSRAMLWSAVPCLCRSSREDIGGKVQADISPAERGRTAAGRWDRERGRDSRSAGTGSGESERLLGGSVSPLRAWVCGTGKRS